MGLYQLDDVTPKTAENGDFWVAENAVVVGNVDIRADASVWFNTVIRGDNERIVIGEGSNVQDGCVLHTDPGFPMEIGPQSTIGHMVMLHGCRIGRNSLIGIGAILLNGAVIGENCLVGAGALITEGKVIPDNSVVLGAPGKIIRQTSEQDLALIRRATENYQRNWRRFRAGLQPTPAG